MLRISLMMLVCFGLAFMSGCGSDGLASLKGNVTVDGQPAPAGIGLEFNPIDSGSPSYAVTDENGEFVAAYTFKRMGIEPGEHRIKLLPGNSGGGREKMPTPGETNLADQRGSRPGPQFPKSYYAEIMKITVDAGNNSISIPLETVKE